VKVVVVLSRPTLSEGEAPARCAVALIRGMMSHGVEVKAIAVRQHYSLQAEPPPDLPVEVIDLAPPRGGWVSLRPLPRPRGELADGQFCARVADEARTANVLHLDETQTLWADSRGRSGELVNVTPNVLARYARLLDDRGLLK
jgi:hypothetical protein